MNPVMAEIKMVVFQYNLEPYKPLCFIRHIPSIHLSTCIVEHKTRGT